jgi:cytochrome c-type protein NapB
MMKPLQAPSWRLASVIMACFGCALGLATGSYAESDVPQTFDNQGYKIFDSQRQITESWSEAAPGERNLAGFYELRQYPGSPPRIPHPVRPAFAGEETDCLSCHGKGGFSPEYNKFVPVTPHPENQLCTQCHAQVTTTKLFVETNWQSIAPPKLGLSSLGSSPPPVPHSLQLRENCIACHTGPGTVSEIKVTHAARGDCRQCHAVVVQSAPFAVFERK